MKNAATLYELRHFKENQLIILVICIGSRYDRDKYPLGYICSCSIELFKIPENYLPEDITGVQTAQIFEIIQ